MIDNYCAGACANWIIPPRPCYWSDAHDWSGKNPKTEFYLHVVLPWITFFWNFQGEKDDKIIAVCADDPEFRHYRDIKELPPHRLAEIRRFFEDCIHKITSHIAFNS